MVNFPGKGERYDYFWRSTLTRRRSYLVLLPILIAAWVYGCTVISPFATSYPLLYLLLPIPLVYAAQSQGLRGPKTLAISVFDEHLAVHTHKGKFEILFRDVINIRMRYLPWVSFWYFGSPWTKDQSWRIELYTLNRFDIFYVPSGNSVDADPHRLLMQIKRRVNAARVDVQIKRN